ncbi:hypothetical protein EJB05_19259, partial [Eragrostis curvula]
MSYSQNRGVPSSPVYNVSRLAPKHFHHFVSSLSPVNPPPIHCTAVYKLSALALPIAPPDRIDRKRQTTSGGSMEATSTCEIARLPEELLSAAISRTSPRDACRAAAVSPAFRAAADSDSVWSCFLPRDLPPLADVEPSSAAPSIKGRYLRLAECPVILADGLTSMWLDRETGVKCFMLSARKLHITWGDTPRYWRYIPITGCSFSEAAELLHVWWLEIHGKIDSKMLTQSSTYGAYFVFKVRSNARGLDLPPQNTSVSLGGNKSTGLVCLDNHCRYDEDGVSMPHISFARGSVTRQHEIPPDVLLPRERADGWKELEMGEFYNDEGEDGEVCISFIATAATLKTGLIVQALHYNLLCSHYRSIANPDRFHRKRQTRKGAEESMEVASACEIARLPEELLSAAISRTSPRDACRAAAVSPAFRVAADSDAVWSCFQPSDPPPLAEGELEPAPRSKKELFMRLTNNPVLLSDGLMSMWLDRESSAKCYMLSARALCIIWGDTPQYWRWIPLTDSRFAEAAKLRAVCWLEIRGKMQSQMLSKNTKYAAYMVFKIDDENYGLDSPLQEAVVSIGENRSTRQACLQGYDNVDDDDEEEVPENYRPMMLPARRRFRRRTRRVPPPEAHVQLPQKRADGWMELEMGEFSNEGGEDGEVSISLMETRGGNWKKGLIVHGIEIRVKK